MAHSPDSKMQPRLSHNEQGSQPIWSEALGPTALGSPARKSLLRPRTAAKSRRGGIRYSCRRVPFDANGRTAGDRISLPMSRPASTAGAFDRNHIVQDGTRTGGKVICAGRYPVRTTRPLGQRPGRVSGA